MKLTDTELYWIIEALEVDKFDRHQDDWYDMTLSEQEVTNLIDKLNAERTCPNRDHAMYCKCDQCIIDNS